MPKKSSRKKSSPKKVPSRHFLWSIFFFSMAAAVNIYMVGIAKGMSDPYTWPLVAVLLSAITLVTIGYERKAGKLGTGEFLWSILFAALTVAVTVYDASTTNYEMWSSIAAGSATVGFILLIYEKFNKK